MLKSIFNGSILDMRHGAGQSLIYVEKLSYQLLKYLKLLRVLAVDRIDFLKLQINFPRFVETSPNFSRIYYPRFNF